MKNLKKSNTPTNWYYNESGKYTVNGHVSVKDLAKFVENGKLTVSFGNVFGNFDCFDLGLTTLQGCPARVEGNFNCSDNPLEDYEYGPESVRGTIEVTGTLIKKIPIHIDCRTVTDMHRTFRSVQEFNEYFYNTDKYFRTF